MQKKNRKGLDSHDRDRDRYAQAGRQDISVLFCCSGSEYSFALRLGENLRRRVL